MPAPILAGLFRNKEDYGTCVSRRIAGIPDFSDLPLAADLERHFLYVARSDIRKRDNRHLSTRLRANVFSDALHSLRRVWLDDVREIIHQSRWRRNLDRLKKKEKPGCLENGEDFRRRGKTQQRYVQDLLSLDFMVRE
jgi:hypothetical protein